MFCRNSPLLFGGRDAEGDLVELIGIEPINF
jgi:hypothetical protein